MVGDEAKAILWGQWCKSEKRWHRSSVVPLDALALAYPSREQAEQALISGGADLEDWSPRPLAIEIGAYEALRDALELAIRCLGYKTLSPEDVACIVTALNTDLAVADAVLEEAGGEERAKGENSP